jgi:hypothetical protein
VVSSTSQPQQSVLSPSQTILGPACRSDVLADLGPGALNRGRYFNKQALARAPAVKLKNTGAGANRRRSK